MLMRRGLENVPQKEWSDILPLVEKIEDLTLRPGKRDGKPTDVKFTLTMTKIRDLDAQSSSVGVRMFIALTWHTSFANYRLPDLAHLFRQLPSRRDSALDPQIDFSERRLSRTLLPNTDVLPPHWHGAAGRHGRRPRLARL